jgi:hypothetical protein
MTRSIFQNNELLPYVDATHDTAPKKPQQLVIENQSNGLAITALILACVSALTFFLIVPAVVAAGFSVAALVMSIKRGLSKKMSIISLIISTVIFITGSLTVGLIVGSHKADHEEPIPANFSLDGQTGLAYAYPPLAQIPCDANGNCATQVDLIATTDECAQGGQFIQHATSVTTGYNVTSSLSLIPSLPKDGTATIQVIFSSVASDSILITSAPVMVCK